MNLAIKTRAHDRFTVVGLVLSNEQEAVLINVLPVAWIGCGRF